MNRRRLLLALVALASAVLTACSWNPKKPYERDAPEVKDAIKLYEAHDAGAAAHTLEDYLSTGPCSEGSIGTPEFVKKRPNGSFDLSLSLFAVAESYGARFGDENKGKNGDDAVKKVGQSLDGPRRGTVECALRVLAAIMEERDVPLEVRAQARYLQGNLHFLNAEYKDAVLAYDASLTLLPATRRPGAAAVAGPDGGAGAGTTTAEDAAWNRAIALRRDEDESKDAGPDAQSDGGDQDGGEKGDGGGEKGDGGNQNADGGNQGEDGGGGQDQAQNEAPKPQPDQAQDRAGQEDRILDQFDNAKTVQQEAARKAGKRHQRGLVDK